MASGNAQCKRRLRVISVAACAALLVIACGTAAAGSPASAPMQSSTVTTSASGPSPTDAGGDALYVCVHDKNGQRLQTPMALDPQVDKLCRKAPEMGPCQYERNACRHRGGRVFTSTGQEITRETEAEYDRRVMRIRMKSN
jgi:hypothetical protein